MKKYIGTKQVMAEPMNELDAFDKGFARSYSVSGKSGSTPREGYHVQYCNPDGTVYDSWSPKDVFEKSYNAADTPLDRMSIEYAEESTRYEKRQGVRFNKLNYLAKALLSAQNESQREYCYLLADRIAQMSDKQVKPNNYDFGTAIKFLKAGGAIRRAGWNGKGMFVVKQIPAHITSDIIPGMQSLPQIAKDIINKRDDAHIDYTNQMLIINKDGRADSWVPSSSDVFAEDWELVME